MGLLLRLTNRSTSINEFEFFKICEGIACAPSNVQWTFRLYKNKEPKLFTSSLYNEVSKKLKKFAYLGKFIHRISRANTCDENNTEHNEAAT